MPDPKLKSAMEEIKVVLRKYDIAAAVVLSSPTHMEYLRHFDPPWLALKLETVDGRVGVRFRCKRADYATTEEWQKAMADTIGTLAGFLDCFRSDVDAFDFLLRTVGKKVKFSHISKEERPDV